MHFYLDDSLMKNYSVSLMKDHTVTVIRLLLVPHFLDENRNYSQSGLHFRTDLGLDLPTVEKRENVHD